MFNFKKNIFLLSVIFIFLIFYLYTLLDNVSNKIASNDKQFYENNVKKEVTLAPTLNDYYGKKKGEHICMFHEMDQLNFSDIDGGVWKQGYPIQLNPDKWNAASVPLKVYVVPHSHNDPGWIMTYQQYYEKQTRNILNSAISSLMKYPKLKFIYAEISFFILFWDESNSEIRDNIKKLVRSGRLEIVTGGWVMNDEANTHYYAMVDQMIEGNQWLYDNLGVKPKSGWAIDPFGHSPTMAYILGRSGISNILLQRVHYIVKKNLSKKKHLEFMWRQTWDNGGSQDTSVFAHMMPFYSYDIPHTCGPEPSVCCQFDFMRLEGQEYSCPWIYKPVAVTESNVKERAELLLDQYRKKSTLYRTNHVLIPLGDDFRYRSTKEFDIQVQNYQLLFDYMNSHKELGVQIEWSTLEDYFSSVRKWSVDYDDSVDTDFPSLSGDFFTYSDRADHYWSGYYTSRPFYKRLSRVVEHKLRAAEILHAQSVAIDSSGTTYPSVDHSFKITKARRHLALFQHHDGITGTAKNFVVEDYGSKLLNAINLSDEIISKCSEYLLAPYAYKNKEHAFLSSDESREKHDSLPIKKSITFTPTSRTRQVVVYNSLSHSTERLVSFAIENDETIVYDEETNKIIDSQIEPNLYESTGFNIVFLAKIPAIGLKCYLLKLDLDKAKKVQVLTDQDTDKFKAFTKSVIRNDGQTYIENKIIKVHFSFENGLIKEVERSGELMNLKVDFRMYASKMGGEMSGAYLFLPQGKSKIIEEFSKYVILKGPIREVVILQNSLVQHEYSLHKTDSIEGSCIHIVNTVDMSKKNNQELSMHLTSAIQNKKREFFTDLNAFQIHKRRFQKKLTLQGNFYPTTSCIYIESDNHRLTLLTGQSLGASSQTTGEVEIMQDRRLNQDDNLGLGQGVLDNKVTPNHFRILLEKRMHSAPKEDIVYGKLSPEALLSYNELIHPLHTMLANTQLESPIYEKTFSALTGNLACNLHLLNVKSLSPKKTALLLHPQGFDKGFETPNLCKSKYVKKLNDLFAHVIVDTIQETSLTLLHDKNSKANDISFDDLSPMHIHTFKLALRKK